MALNFPGPYEVRINYTVIVSSVALDHEQRLNVAPTGTPDPGETFDNIQIVNGAGSFSYLDVEVDAWVALLKPLFSNALTINYADLWKYTAGTFDASFVSTYNIAEVGTSGSGAVSAGQQIFMFRTAEGGSMRVNLMEAVRAASGPINAGSLSTAESNLVNYVIDPLTGQYWLGRDTSYPFAFTNLFPGQNEAVFKKRYRP